MYFRNWRFLIDSGRSRNHGNHPFFSFIGVLLWALKRRDALGQKLRDSFWDLFFNMEFIKQDLKEIRFSVRGIIFKTEIFEERVLELAPVRGAANCRGA